LQNASEFPVSAGAEVVWIAAYLHDWGSCPSGRKKGVDHSVKSKTLAERVSPESRYPAEATAVVLEASSSTAAAAKGVRPKRFC
jgi:hypothetical protein